MSASAGSAETGEKDNAMYNVGRGSIGRSGRKVKERRESASAESAKVEDRDKGIGIGKIGRGRRLI